MFNVECKSLLANIDGNERWVESRACAYYDCIKYVKILSVASYLSTQAFKLSQ